LHLTRRFANGATSHLEFPARGEHDDTSAHSRSRRRFLQRVAASPSSRSSIPARLDEGYCALGGRGVARKQSPVLAKEETGDRIAAAARCLDFELVARQKLPPALGLFDGDRRRRDSAQIARASRYQLACGGSSMSARSTCPSTCSTPDIQRRIVLRPVGSQSRFIRRASLHLAAKAKRHLQVPDRHGYASGGNVPLGEPVYQLISGRTGT
jgi:hypothetical protein